MRGVALVVALVAAGAHANYFYLPFRMLSTADQPFPYYIDDRNASPAGLELAGMGRAVDNAWNAWNGVTCAAPKVISKGFTTGKVPNPYDPYDAFSVTPVWMNSTSDPDFSFVFGTGQIMSIALPLAYGGVLYTCDVYFNAVEFQWSTADVTPASARDVQTAMMHEAGHCLGLDHFGGTGSVMNPLVTTGFNLRALSSDDNAMLCQRNPASGAAASPCSAGDTCNTADLKCLTQPVTVGLSGKACSNGCTLGTGTGACTSPQTCQASAAFAGFNGACLYPGTAVTQVGKACSKAADCGSGSAVCNPPSPATSGLGNFWVNGYCTQSCEVGQPPCPAGSQCLLIGGKNQCASTCRVGTADCRQGYTCLDDGSGSSGLCVPVCYANSDCGDQTQYFCRTCDGICASLQNQRGQIGDGCTTDSECGPGQICRAVDSSGVKTCTQQCARGCGTCVNGSTCTPMANGDLFCLKDCTGPGSCPAGLRCADTSAGKGCVPACTNSTQCPIGENCMGGECYPNSSDADTCGALCVKPDSGHVIPPTPKDGGTGGGGIGGCGCQDMAGAFPFALLALAGLAWTRRK